MNLPSPKTGFRRMFARPALQGIPVAILSMMAATADPLPAGPAATPRETAEQNVPEPTAAGVLALLGGVILLRRWKSNAR